MELERIWDDRLGIRTVGQDDSNSDEYRYPYEPTPYTVLERLAESGLIREGNVVLDYGCGKGRVGFFLSHETGCRTIGIEYDQHIYDDALRNQRDSNSKSEFVLTRAEEYDPPEEVDRCYFFNPFSVELLHGVLRRIIGSWYECPREIFLFFYYPSDEYIACLMSMMELEFYDEIECGDLFPGNDVRERVMIFWLPDLEEFE